jgi:cyclopropane-fatty-acyl-phospholipid synthase
LYNFLCSILGGLLMLFPLELPAIQKRLLKAFGDTVAPARIRLRLRSSSESAGFTGPHPVATLIVQDARTLLRLVLNPEIEFGDAYTEGRLLVEGDLAELVEAAFRKIPRNRTGTLYAKMISRWLRWTQNNSLRGSRHNIHRHYDVTTEFYKLWLDSQLVYTCAYFADESMTLEQAQTAKMDHVCRKLQLQPDERVVEAGCGWGALALHMASHYHVRVKAFNISHEQIAFARARARQMGLQGQVEFVEDDYRNISGDYDAFVSIGMLEHVGKDHYDDMRHVIGRTVKKTTRGLLHFIGRNKKTQLNAWIRKRIFPGAYPPTLREALELLEPLDLSVLDVENLRMHYARTLEEWLARFEKSAGRVADMFGAEFVRLWRLYLAGSLAGFRAGSMQLFQVLFAGSECQSIPITRNHLYCEEPSDKELKWMHATP